MEKRPPLSIFVTILSIFAVVVMLTGTAITVANFVQARRAALNVASATFDTTARRINEQRSSFYSPVNLFVELYSRDPRIIGTPDRIDAVLLSMLGGLRRTPQISGVYVGYENGDFYQVLSFSDYDKETVAVLGGPPESRYGLQLITSDNRGARTETLRFFNDEMREIASLTNASPAYDPRARGWYKDARAQPRQLIRTSPYVFASTPQVGLTVATSFDGPIGGVVAADVTLDRLSSSIEAVRPNKKHRILIFEEDGGLIATPNPDEVLKRTGSGSDVLLTPAKIADLKDPVIRAIAQQFDKSGPIDLESLNVEGEEYFASVVRQAMQDGLKTNTYILYAAPRSDFEGSMTNAAVRSIALGLLILLLVSPGVIYLARKVSRPLTELSNNAKLIEAIIDAVPAPLFYKGSDTRFIGVNRAFEEAFGVHRTDIIGKRLTETNILSEADRVSYQDENEEAAKAAGSLRKETLMPFADGALHSVLYHLKAFQHTDGAPGGIVGTFVDISELKEAERNLTEAQKTLMRENARIQAIIDAIPNPIFYKGPDTRFIGFNRAYEAYFGIRRDDLIGMRVLDLEYLPHQDRIHYQAEDENLIRMGGSAHREMSMPYADGKIHPTLYYVSAFSLQDGTSGGLVGTFVDISAQKDGERALAEAKEIAEAATKAKSDFLASMSHEIRTPMNGVTGMADLLAQTKLDDEQKHMLRTIRESGNALITVINDILDFSKIEAGRLEIEDISMSVADALEGVAGTLTPNATKKSVRIHTFVDPAIPTAVLGDPVRVRQILFNLTGNAVKFSDKKDVSVRATLLPPVNDERLWLRFEVTDQGIGISEENQAKLFQAFSQAESSTTRKFGGTGLGLAICKRLVELMNGRLGVQSKEGEGSTFWVEIPFRNAAEPRISEAQRDLQGVRVLIVGSPEMRCISLAAYLQHWGATHAVAGSEGQAIEELAAAERANAPFTAVVIDLDLDRVRQKAALSALREAQKDFRGKAPFIVLDDFEQRGARIKSKDAVTLSANPLVRYRFVTAVAVAVGRASPEVHEDEDATAIKPLKAPTVDEALARKQLILLAEDNPTNQDVIRRQLGVLGYACEIVSDGAQALKAWNTGRYALLLTDCHMPEMDGYELTGAIRLTERGTTRRGPIIAITANALQGEAERCLAAGMDDYLTKPVAMPALQATLKKWLPVAADGTPVAGEPANAASTPARAPNAAPVNDRALKDIFGEDDATFKEILVGFVEPSQAIILDIIGAVEGRRADDVRGAAHKLKGSARSIGADALADTCAALEVAGRSADWIEIETLAPRAREQMAGVLGYIEGL